MEGGISRKNVTDDGLNMVQESNMDSNTHSYADILNSKKVQPKVTFRKIDATGPTSGEFEAMIPKSSVMEVNERSSNLIFVNFIGKRLTFPLVENYKWTPSSMLTKDSQIKVSVWVKLHDVPLATFTANGLSVIASKIGTPLMFNSYICSICTESRGRSSYARAITEIETKVEFKDLVVVVVLNIDDEGYTCAKIIVECKWKPQLCLTCQDNVLYKGNSVPKVFVDHYMQFLGIEAHVTNLEHQALFRHKLNHSKAENMVHVISDDEVRMAMFSIGNDKASGPDGYTSFSLKKLGCRGWRCV
nr:hypothetical protein [Tanacetum cinerariifolium]